MTSCQYQQALSKSFIVLLTVTLLAMAGCGDKPQNNPPSNESNQTPVTATTPEQSPQPDSNNAVTTDTPTDDSQAVTDPQQEAQNQESTVSESPAGEQDTQADATVKPEPETEKLSAEAGKELYEKQCKVCHEAGLLNAPKYGDKAAWQPHISKGIETLYEHSAKGFNKMPPQATNGVTEAQVHAAVDYMVAGSS